MATTTYDIPIVFFIEVEYDGENPDYLKEREKVTKSLAEELGYCIGDFDFIYDSISEKVNGVVNSIKVQKTNKS